jgi:SAM-dependent methyltransferase
MNHLVDVILLAILVASFLTLITMLMSLWVLTPYVPTPMKVVRHMLKLAELKGGERIYDLGCGDGRILIEAKKQFPDISATGYELPIGVWMLAKIKVWCSRIPVEIRLGNYFNADLRDADAIFVYLIPEVLPRLKRKLDEELKPGTKVISHGFEFKEKESKLVERCPLPTWHFFCPKGKVGPRVFVYEW